MEQKQKNKEVQSHDGHTSMTNQRVLGKNVFYWVLVAAGLAAWQGSYMILDVLFPAWNYRWYKLAFTLACYVGFLRFLQKISNN